MKPKLHLESLELLGWRFGLQTIRALLDELGRPELSLKTIHVAGSNGKGSTCAFMASFLKHRGSKTGLYTSPHLCDIRERFRIDGAWITEAAFKSHTE
ncbi:MAG TPA: bifunctional folylpolyglutamate synthase/dihydrofolate synthase, partial [bacterium]|nr:bifunctional folylpolyglutamate synthase/dihydrofolate synthase [bacterium]